MTLRLLSPLVMALAALVVLVASSTACGPSQPAPHEARHGGPDERNDAVVEAMIRGTFAHHLLLAKEARKNPDAKKHDRACYAQEPMTDDELRTMVAHQRALLAADRAQVVAWAKNQPSPFDPARDLLPLLHAHIPLPDHAPVTVASMTLAERAKIPPARARSLASLYEMVLEIDRDGDLLQDQIDLYVALGVPVYDGQLGLPSSDADLLARGDAMARATCASPFDVDAAAWQIAGRKLASWAEKRLHVRDADVVARELLGDPEVKALLPALEALPPQRIAVLGHSFTMDLHWSSPGSFTGIAAALLHRVNPRVDVRHFSDGGLGAARAERELFQTMLASKPERVLLVLLTRKDDDYDALGRMLDALAKSGVRAHLFDNVREPSERDREMAARVRSIALSTKTPLLEVSSKLAIAPERGRFVCLDGIHMTEPYHRFMAKEWLRYLTSTR